MRARVHINEASDDNVALRSISTNTTGTPSAFGWKCAFVGFERPLANAQQHVGITANPVNGEVVVCSIC